ncbi:tetratricopeptide repeat protein [Actinoplanes sp. L3-i22]|uniref:tetratricopeptide repeat protein n=1 Tax=Actinoplanes sp. L3-i22 TaxID=2836373 RepID=UPI001C77C6BF|nr:tetratricopeptide repeat protein [Actinoplanes sp. L3-i22]BCY07346.1 hypothetical protein L3i22_024340 [Actinoplanes sp. L3-i22]
MSHPSPLTPALERAHSLVAAGDLAGAAELLERAIEIGQATLSQDDPDVLATQRELASLRQQLGDPAAARGVLEAAHAAGQFSLGDDDPLMLQISYDLGVVAEELGNRDEARIAFGRVADFGPMMLGPGHWAVTRAQAYLGQDPTSPVRIEPAHQVTQSGLTFPPPDNHPTVLSPTIPQPGRQLPPPPPISRPPVAPQDSPHRGNPWASPQRPAPVEQVNPEAQLPPPPAGLSGPLNPRSDADPASSPAKNETQDTFRPESPWGPAPRIAKEPAETPFHQVKPGVFGMPERPDTEAAPALYHRGANDSVVVHRPDPVIMPLSPPQAPAPEARPDSITPGDPAAAQTNVAVRPEPTPVPRPESVTPGVSPPLEEATTTLPTVEPRNAPQQPAESEMPANQDHPEPDAFTAWPDFNRWPGEPQPTPVTPPEPLYQPVEQPYQPVEQPYQPVEQQEHPTVYRQPTDSGYQQQGGNAGVYQRPTESAEIVPRTTYLPTEHAGVYQPQPPAPHPGVYHQATDGTWQGTPNQISPQDLSPPSPYGESSNRKRGMALFAVIAATLAAVVAVAAMVFTLAQRTHKGEGDDPQPGSPTLAGAPPGDVKLSDLGSKIDVSWSDPTDATVSFMVTMAHPGEQLKPVSTVGPGKTSRRIEGLSPALDYCFAVVAVYGTNKFATSPQVCTDRGKK